MGPLHHYHLAGKFLGRIDIEPEEFLRIVREAAAWLTEELGLVYIWVQVVGYDLAPWGPWMGSFQENIELRSGTEVTNRRFLEVGRVAGVQIEHIWKPGDGTSDLLQAYREAEPLLDDVVTAGDVIARARAAFTIVRYDKGEIARWLLLTYVANHAAMPREVREDLGEKAVQEVRRVIEWDMNHARRRLDEREETR